MSIAPPDSPKPTEVALSPPRSLPVLLGLSSAYLGLPWILFFIGWLRWYVAWPMVAVVVVALASLIWKVSQAVPGRQSVSFSALFSSGRSGFSLRRCSLGQALIWAGMALLLVSLSGAGGVGLQEGDYFKHNAVLKHLIESPWPVWIPTDQGAFPLVYYPAWYLPGAVVGKWFGWEWANLWIFLWTYGGVLLALGWFALLVGRCTPMVLAMFFLFSAPDVVGAALFKLLGWDPGPPRPPPVPDAWGIDWYGLRWWNWELRWWAGPYTWNYCSHMELLFWVPQQALGAWICSGMMLAGVFWAKLQWQRWAWVPVALSALWSPLVTVGLLPFLALGFLADPTPMPQRFRNWLQGPNLAAGAVLAVAGLYYAAHFSPLPFSNDPRAEFRLMGFANWPLWMYLFRLVCFWIIDVASIAGLILLVRRPRKGVEPILFTMAVGVLLLLALFRYGLNNDLGMRVSMPWLFVLAVLLTKGIVRKRLWPIRRWILWGSLALMAATPVAEVYRHLCEMRRQGRWLYIPPLCEVQSLWELNQLTRQKSGNDFFLRQYIGSPDGVFFRFLAVPGNRPTPKNPDSPPIEKNAQHPRKTNPFWNGIIPKMPKEA